MAASSFNIEFSFKFLNGLYYCFYSCRSLIFFTFVMINNLDSIRVWAISCIKCYVHLHIEARYSAFQSRSDNVHTYSGPNELCNGYHFRIILLL
jgi:hypothetical protein